jgi:putative transposase
MADAEDNTIILSFKYRLLPTRKQHKTLAHILEEQRILYNAALQSRIDCYRKTRKSLSYMTQAKQLTELRELPEYFAMPVNLQRWTLSRLDDAYGAFFKRVKRGEEPGFPRFRGKGRWQSFGFSEFSGIRFDGKRTRFRGLPGGLRVHLHRPMPDGKILSCTFTRNAKGWYICFQMRVVKQPLPANDNAVGIDMGLKSLMVLSTGEAIPNIRKARQAEKEQRIRQRALARCKRSSKRRLKVKRRLVRLYEHTTNGRRTYAHQLSARLVREHDFIAIENLNVKGMVRGNLAKSIHDAGWGQLRQFLTYKAANADRVLVAVNPRNTSQECSGCGVIVPKTLRDRVHDCPGCGLVMDRDENAARNILERARSGARATQRRAA